MIDLNLYASAKLQLFWALRDQNQITLEDYKQVQYALFEKGYLDEKLHNRRIEMVVVKDIMEEKVMVTVRDKTMGTSQKLNKRETKS